MFSHYYEPIGGEEIHKVDYSHIISPYQVIGKDKEIRNLVTNVEQREDLNTQVRKRGEKGCKKRGRQADNKWTNLKKYKRKQKKSVCVCVCVSGHEIKLPIFTKG